MSALPEEMAARETLELEQALRETLGRRLDLVVVNGVYPDRFSHADADRLRAVASQLGEALRTSEPGAGEPSDRRPLKASLASLG